MQPRIIQRKAIDSSGTLGSLYDEYQDCVLKQPNDMISEIHKVKVQGSVECELIYGKTVESENPLKMVGVEDQLRLNLLLNPKLRTGIAALFDHPRPIDNYTRFLYFSCTDREQVLPTDAAEAKELLKTLYLVTQMPPILLLIYATVLMLLSSYSYQTRVILPRKSTKHFSNFELN